MLLVGGAFTAGITNYLLEITSALAQDMNCSAFEFFESIRSIEYKGGTKTLDPLDRAPA